MSRKQRRLTVALRVAFPISAVLLGAGSAAAGDPPLFPMPAVPLDKEAGLKQPLDANGDGLLDLVVAQVGDGLELVETASPLTLLPPVRITEGLGTNSLLVGDFNSDGEGDVMSVAWDALDLFFGHGDGTFDDGPQQALTECTRGTALDADADGYLDLLLANYAGGVIPALGDGAGHFTLEATVAAGGYFLATGDIDADGFVDFAGAEAQSDTTTIVRGTGGGQFAPWMDYPTAAVKHVALEHLDGDGWLDFAWSGWAFLPMQIQFSLGGGLFGQPTAPAGRSHLGGFLAADVDEDGDLDLILSHVTAWNDGAGSFSVDAAGGADLVAELAADLDADGALDLVAATHDDGYGYGNGSLYVTHGLPGPEFELPLKSPAFPDLPEAIFLADLEDGGGVDVVIADLTQVHVLPGLGDGRFGADVLSSTHTGLGCCIALAGGDFDGDGHGDLLGAYDKKQLFNSLGVRLLRGLGNGSVVPAIDSPTPGKIQGLDVADLDLDGDLDAVARKTNVATTLLNDGTGKLQDADVEHSDLLVDVAIGDADGDGLPDLAVVRTDDVLRMLPGLGGGQFGNPLDLELVDPKTVAFGDIDGDGREEAAVGQANTIYTQADVRLVRLQPGAGLVVLEQIEISGLGPGGAAVLAVRDVTGDGFCDVVLASSTEVTVLSSDGLDGLLPASSFHTGVGEQRLGSADGGGRMDIVNVDLSDYHATQVRTYLGQAVGPWLDVGHPLAGAKGVPTLAGFGSLQAHSPVTLHVAHAAPEAAAWLVLGSTPAMTPFKGGTLVPLPAVLLGGLITDVHGLIHLSGSWPDGVPADGTLYAQVWIADARGPAGFSATNGLLLSPH